MKQQKRNKLGINLLLINSLIYLSISLYTPYLTSYYSKSGISALKIGILTTIGPIVAIFIQPLWAVVSDRTGRRKAILSLVILGSGLSMFSFYIGKTFVTFFLASFLLALFSTSIIPLSDAITLRITKKHHFDFSKIRMGGTVGYAVMVIFSGAIVKRNPSLQFILGFIGYSLLFFAVQRLSRSEVEDDSMKQQEQTPEIPVKQSFHPLHIFESKQILFLLAFAFINQVGLSFHYTFLGVYMVKLGYSEGTIGLINSIAAFSEIPVLFLINFLLKKSSALTMSGMACLFVALRIITMTGENLGFIILSQALHGMSFMTLYYSCAVFISNHVKPENQSKGQSILTIIQGGIGSIIGNIAGGYLVDSLGLKNSYRTMAAIVITVSVAVIVIYTIFQKWSRNKKYQ